MTKRDYVISGLLLAVIGGLVFAGDIPTYRPWVGAVFICLGVATAFRATTWAESPDADTERPWHAQLEPVTGALGLVMFGVDRFWPGHGLFTLAVALVAWPALARVWARRSVAPDGSWLW